MLVAALAYNLGAQSGEPEAVASEIGVASETGSAFWPGVIRVEATQRIEAEVSLRGEEPIPVIESPTPVAAPMLTPRRPQLAEPLALGGLP